MVYHFTYLAILSETNVNKIIKKYIKTSMQRVHKQLQLDEAIIRTVDLCCCEFIWSKNNY